MGCLHQCFAAHTFLSLVGPPQPSPWFPDICVCPAGPGALDGRGQGLSICVQGCSWLGIGHGRCLLNGRGHGPRPLAAHSAGQLAVSPPCTLPQLLLSEWCEPAWAGPEGSCWGGTVCVLGPVLGRGRGGRSDSLCGLGAADWGQL